MVLAGVILCGPVEISVLQSIMVSLTLSRAPVDASMLDYSEMALGPRSIVPVSVDQLLLGQDLSWSEVSTGVVSGVWHD